MKSKQLTCKKILDNKLYLENLYRSPNISSTSTDKKYPLTLLQCNNALQSTDMRNGWIRQLNTTLFCDLCTKNLGESHRPACKFNGVVGNLKNYQKLTVNKVCWYMKNSEIIDHLVFAYLFISFVICALVFL